MSGPAPDHARPGSAGYGRPDDPESPDAATPEALAEARALLARTGGIRRRSWLGSRRRQAFAGIVVFGVIGFLVYQGLNSAAEYFLTTKQAVAQRSSLGRKPFRMEGTVEHDVRQVGTRIDFTVYAQGVAVPVVSTGSPPQLFRPGIPVVLEGRWGPGGTYLSDLIMVKHTATYRAAHPNRLRSQLPRTRPPRAKSGP